MEKLNIKIYILFFCALFASCSESLEDTYKDYSGNGKIRYLAKCYDLTVKPGWERIELNWKNGIDATVTNIKVRWESNGVFDEKILDKDATTLNVTNLKDGSYMFEVIAINENGAKSMSVVNYGRPYTENHEVVRTFTRAIVRHYKINNKLVMFMDKWSDNIEEIRLHYTDLTNVEQNVLLDKDFFDKKVAVINDINLTKEIKVSRKGKIEGCADLIVFSDLIVKNEITLNSDFKLALRSRYGLSDQSPEEKAKLDEFLATTTELEFDYNLTSLENIMYCPNLKTIYLGKNRFLDEKFLAESTYSILFEKDKTVEILDFIKTNNIVDFSVKKYAEHYLKDIERDYIESVGIPKLPENLNYISKDKIVKKECTIPEMPEHDSKMENIFDNDPTTYWYPVQFGDPRQFEFSIDLDKTYPIRGFMFRQRGFDPKTSAELLKFLPSTVEISVSKDYLVWTTATHVITNTTGRAPGEITLLPMTVVSDVKYIRFKISDQNLSPAVYGCTLADFIPYL